MYLELAQKSKSSKIEMLLSQTDACLRHLASRLHINSIAEARDTALSDVTNAAVKTTVTKKLQHSSEAWDSLAMTVAPGPSPTAATTNATTTTAIATATNPSEQHQQHHQTQQQPSILTGGELRSYQLQGLQWLISLRNNNLNGILADEMGLGKTIQVIALIAHCIEKNTVIEEEGGMFFCIACPASVLPNWEKEFAAWAPSIDVVSYNGTTVEREKIYRRNIRPTQKKNKKKQKSVVVLTTYDFLMGKEDRPRLSSMHWEYIIIDEGHRLKNAGCKLNAELSRYSTGHRLLLTGTPLQNGINELWSLLNFLMPHLFNCSEDFDTWFGGALGSVGERSSASPNTSSDSDAEDEAQHAALLSEEELLIVTSRLHHVLRPFMLRRLKESVATELPQKKEILLSCRPSPYQSALLQLLTKQLEGSQGVRGVNNTFMEMKTICNHPLLSRLHVSGTEHCLLDATQHASHFVPLEVRLCGKMEVLDRALLKLKSNNHKVLLFCTMTRVLDVMEEYLEWRGFEYCRLDGSTSAADRGELVRSFNAPGSNHFVFLLSVRAGGGGLNLQAADTVIFYDTDWNPQMDAQAAARAHRIGQTRQVLVVRLMTVGTVEERIIQVAEEKRGMAERSITGGFFDGKTSAAERQRYLLGLLKEQAATMKKYTANKKNTDGSGEEGGLISDEALSRFLARGKDKLENESLGPLPSTLTLTNRLASEIDVASMVVAATEAMYPKDPDADKEFGRGKRLRHEK